MIKFLIQIKTDEKINQKYLSEYNESQYFDWKEIRLQRRIIKLHNLNPEIDSSLQEDDLFPEKQSSIMIDNIDNLEWRSFIFQLIEIYFQYFL